MTDSRNSMRAKGSKSRLGLLGLCAVVFGLMAFSTGAQATVGAHWWILNSAGTVKTDAGSLEASVGLEKDSAVITLHAKLSGGTAFLILCTTPIAENIKLQGNGSVAKGSKVKFTGCTIDLNGVPSAACTPKDPVGGAGTIITKSLHGLIVLHELASGAKDELVLLLPDEGEIFATLLLGAECSVGEKINIIGPHIVFKDCENLFKTHLVKHLIEEGPLTELWLISKTEEHKASILGSAWTFLTLAHAGLKFGGEAA